MLGKTTDPDVNINIYRDGGSSVSANGYHMMIFADTLIDSGSPSPSTPLVAHNSFAYYGYVSGSDPSRIPRANAYTRPIHQTQPSCTTSAAKRRIP